VALEFKFLHTKFSMANYINFKVRPVIRYFGGKSFLARRIIELIPDSSVYVEPFAGGLNVLLNKCKYGQEIVGDLNVELIHLYTTLRDYSSTLLDKLKDVPYSEEVFNRALAAGVVEDPVERALNFLIKHRMSRSGMGGDYSRLPEWWNNGSWDYLHEDLKFTAHRLQGVSFYTCSALELIDLFDGPGTSFYLDPPYYPLTRESPEVYEHEMTSLQHLFLLKRILKCQGNVVISGYNNPAYNRELKDWERYSFEVANHSSQQKLKSRRVEVVWVKPPRI
jgi:DNA adenine methylase